MKARRFIWTCKLTEWTDAKPRNNFSRKWKRLVGLSNRRQVHQLNTRLTIFAEIQVGKKVLPGPAKHNMAVEETNDEEFSLIKQKEVPNVGSSEQWWRTTHPAVGRKNVKVSINLAQIRKNLYARPLWEINTRFCSVSKRFVDNFVRNDDVDNCDVHDVFSSASTYLVKMDNDGDLIKQDKQ